MKWLLEVILWFVLVGCAKINLPATPGSSCTDSSGTGVIGSDSNCYTCGGGNYAYYGYIAGYCGAPNGADVSCCSNTPVGNFDVVCSSTKPYLCSDGLCYSNYQSGLTCVYDP
jgi:hypothetical protein